MRVFLTAEWRRLLMLNYTVDPKLLERYLPKDLELDQWKGATYVSMVGFLFLQTKVFGIRVPFHSNFEEVNLRFYVRRKTSEGWRRGVVFIKEIVPRKAIATIAKVFYNEPYIALPMRHNPDIAAPLRIGIELSYEWFYQCRWNSMRATVHGASRQIEAGSEEEFITEHYWGYTAQGDRACTEYAVEHARWNILEVSNPVLNCDIAALYGRTFLNALEAKPVSSFIAEGSPILVRSACDVESAANSLQHSK